MGDQIRIVHAADIHLDSRLRGLGRLNREDVVGELRLATRHAFDNLVRHCVETVPDALVLAGDLYDGDWTDYSTGVHFVERMRDLHDVGVPVVIVRGNHDAESVISKNLTLPENVHDLSTSEPQTVDLEGLALHGQGFGKPAVLDNLVLAYPAPRPGVVNIGLLHTSVGGYDGHDPYAPCTLDHLVGRGYEYFALGHIHKREILAGGANTVAFSGNLQGRHPRETGEKGALEVVLAPGGEADVTFIPFDVARWDLLKVVVDDAADREEILARVEHKLVDSSRRADGRPVVTRVRLTGTHTLAGRLADREQLGHEIRPVAARHDVVVDTVTSDVIAPVARRHMPDAQRALLEAAIADVRNRPEVLREDPAFKKDLAQLISEVNLKFTKPAGRDLASDEVLAGIIDEAAAALLARADGGLT